MAKLGRRELVIDVNIAKPMRKIRALMSELRKVERSAARVRRLLGVKEA